MRLHSWTGGSLRRVYIGQFLSLQRIYYMTELDNVLYIIIALVNTKTGFNLSETHEVWNKARGLKKKIKHNPYVSFDTVSHAMYGNNHFNMIVTFQNVTSPPHAVNVPFIIYIITYKGIKVVIRTEFINMTVLLSK